MGAKRNAFATWLATSGFRVSDVARLFDVTPQTVNNWRRGKTPTMSTAQEIARRTRGAVPVGSWGA